MKSRRLDTREKYWRLVLSFSLIACLVISCNSSGNNEVKVAPDDFKLVLFQQINMCDLREPAIAEVSATDRRDYSCILLLHAVNAKTGLPYQGDAKAALSARVGGRIIQNAESPLMETVKKSWTKRFCFPLPLDSGGEKPILHITYPSGKVEDIQIDVIPKARVYLEPSRKSHSEFRAMQIRGHDETHVSITYFGGLGPDQKIRLEPIQSTYQKDGPRFISENLDNHGDGITCIAPEGTRQLKFRATIVNVISDERTLLFPLVSLTGKPEKMTVSTPGTVEHVDDRCKWIADIEVSTPKKTKAGAFVFDVNVRRKTLFEVPIETSEVVWDREMEWLGPSPSHLGLNYLRFNGSPIGNSNAVAIPTVSTRSIVMKIKARYKRFVPLKSWTESIPVLPVAKR